ncbi:MAG TPA: hypothetical protein VGW77_18770 [Candidatus Binatia bacterium]|nr:hypothetical protein [Candidatus Binatia bacterium]
MSGPGSSLFQTATVRAALPGVIQQFGVKSMLDIPCGDFNWMKEVTLDVDRYIGGDIIKQLRRDYYRIRYDQTGEPFLMVRSGFSDATEHLCFQRRL